MMQRLGSKPLLWARQAPIIGPSRHLTHGRGLLSATVIVHRDELLFFARGPIVDYTTGYRTYVQNVWRWTAANDPGIDLRDVFNLSASAPAVITYATIGKTDPTGPTPDLDLGATSVFEIDATTLGMYVRYGASGESYIVRSTDKGVTWGSPQKLTYAVGGADFTTASPGFVKVGSTWYIAAIRQLRTNGGTSGTKVIWGIDIRSSTDLATFSDPITTLDPDELASEGDLFDTSLMTCWLGYEDGYFYVVAGANGLEVENAGSGGFYHDSPRGFQMFRFHEDTPETIEVDPQPLYVRRSDEAAVWSPTLIPWGGDMLIPYEGEWIEAEPGSAEWADARNIQYDGYGDSSHSCVMVGRVQGINTLSGLWNRGKPYVVDGNYTLTDYRGRRLTYNTATSTQIVYDDRSLFRFRMKETNGFTHLYHVSFDASIQGRSSPGGTVNLQFSAAANNGTFNRQFHIVPHGSFVKIVSRNGGFLLTAEGETGPTWRPETGRADQLWKLEAV